MFLCSSCHGTPLSIHSAARIRCNKVRATYAFRKSAALSKEKKQVGPPIIEGTGKIVIERLVKFNLVYSDITRDITKVITLSPRRESKKKKLGLDEGFRAFALKFKTAQNHFH